MGKIWTLPFFFFEISKVHEQKCWTHEKTTRKNFRPTNDLREKNSDLRNTHEKKFWTHDIPTKAQWHDGTQPTKFSTLQPRITTHRAHFKNWNNNYKTSFTKQWDFGRSYSRSIFHVGREIWGKSLYFWINVSTLLCLIVGVGGRIKYSRGGVIKIS